MPERQMLTEPRSGGGLLLLRRRAPLSRRTMAYFCSGAHTGRNLPEFPDPRHNKAMEPLFHFALALLSAGAPWLAAITVAAIVVASHRRTGQVGPSRWGSVRQAGALKSVFRSDSYTRQHRRRPALEFEERSVHDRIQFSIFGLFSPSSERCSGGPRPNFSPEAQLL
jgi:hypothetical protein